MSSAGDDVMTPVSFKSQTMLHRLIFGNRGIRLSGSVSTWPLESPLPAWQFGDDPTSHVPLECPSTTGLKYILPRHLVFRDALTAVLASHCLLCTGSSILNLPRTLNPVAVAMLDVNDFSKAPLDPSGPQLLECPSRQVVKNRDEEPVDVVVAMLIQELQSPSAAATPSRSGRASASASPESKMSTT